MQVPRRASDEDYTYTYKGVKYTYISENNYTNFFNTSVHTPETYGWYKDDDGWFVNAEGAYFTAASIDIPLARRTFLSKKQIECVGA